MASTAVAVRNQRQPWDKHPKETYKAWEGFTIFRDLGVNRTLQAVADRLGKSLALMKDWSGKYDWVERAGAYDEYLDRQQRDVSERARQEMLERHSSAAALLTVVGMQRLAGDQKAKVQKLDPNELSGAEVVRMISEGIRAERLAAGEPTDLVRGALLVSAQDVSKIAHALIDIAMRHVPEDAQPAFVREVDAYARSQRQQ